MNNGTEDGQKVVLTDVSKNLLCFAVLAVLCFPFCFILVYADTDSTISHFFKALIKSLGQSAPVNVKTKTDMPENERIVLAQIYILIWRHILSKFIGCLFWKCICWKHLLKKRVLFQEG